jgi:colanic acid/amylovoran biosynthesis glycosyltransferase
MMKLAYLTIDYGQISETFVTDLVNSLSHTVDNLTVICNQDYSKKNYVKILHNVQVKEANFLDLESLLDRFQFRLASLYVQQSSIFQFAILQKHGYRYLKPILQRLQLDVTYIDFGSVAVMAQRTLKELAIPFVVHFHGSDISSALNNPAYQQELQNVFQNAGALIVASNYIRRLLILEGAPPEKIHVVRHEINLEGLIPKPWSERKSLPPSVVFLGRFTPKKHPVALVEAFALVKQKIPDAQLTMIGDGSEMPRVKQRIEKLGLEDSVKLCGALPRAEALAIVNQHWIFAQHSVTAPSGDQEGFGISLAEAAALELPIVSTLHNGIPEQVIDGKTGFLVKEFDYESMAENIIKLLLNPDLGEKMGKYGRQNISQLCQITQRTNKIKDILIAASINVKNE